MFFSHWLEKDNERVGPMSHWLKENEEEQLVIEKELDLTKVTRVEVIDQNGRSYVNWNKNNSVTYSIQNNNKTLKIFIKNKNE